MLDRVDMQQDSFAFLVPTLFTSPYLLSFGSVAGLVFKAKKSANDGKYAV